MILTRLTSDNYHPPHTGAGFLCPPGLPTCPPLSLYSPADSRRLCGLLWPSGGIFCARGQQVRGGAKTQTSVKAIYRPATALYRLVSIPVFPRRQTAHSACYAPIQGTKQPRPAPLWSKPGYYVIWTPPVRQSLPGVLQPLRGSRPPSALA